MTQLEFCYITNFKGFQPHPPIQLFCFMIILMVSWIISRKNTTKIVKLAQNSLNISFIAQSKIQAISKSVIAWLFARMSHTVASNIKLKSLQGVSFSKYMFTYMYAHGVFTHMKDKLCVHMFTSCVRTYMHRLISLSFIF